MTADPRPANAPSTPSNGAGETASSPIVRALISVSDKSGLAELGTALAGMGVEILSTGGSARHLREAGLPVVDVADHTGFPEMMDGRVKTLHPRIHGGILARRDLESHRQAMESHDIAPIDLVVINLYPFRETVAKGADFATCIENIDIGGPALIRAAAKNHDAVTIVTSPGDYETVIDEMTRQQGATSAPLRRRLAAKAYAHTAAYDAAIAGWFSQQIGDGDGDKQFPPQLLLEGARREILRYGENPHQRAAFYSGGAARPGLATARQVQGKALSYNNLNDTDAAFELVAEFETPAVAIIKHANPCGVAIAPEDAKDREGKSPLTAAYERALACDPVSAFGGIIAVNRALDREIAAAISQIFTEVIIAPDAEAAALEILAAKKNLRILLTGEMPDPMAAGLSLRSLAGGYLVQDRDNGRPDRRSLKTVTRRSPDTREMRDMLFAFTVCKHVKSNAIVYARDGATVGIGAGQMSRVDSARIAARKAEDAAAAAKEAGRGDGTPLTQGSVAASDAFFPFADGLLAVASAGASAVIQPGGSMRDDEVIAAADQAGLAMVLTGMRHFRH